MVDAKSESRSNNSERRLILLTPTSYNLEVFSFGASQDDFTLAYCLLYPPRMHASRRHLSRAPVIDNGLPAGNPRLSRQTAMRGLARLVNLYVGNYWYDTSLKDTTLSCKSHAMLSDRPCLRDSGDIVLENVEMCAMLLPAACSDPLRPPSLPARPSSFLFPFADPISSLSLSLTERAGGQLMPEIRSPRGKAQGRRHW